MEQWYDKEEDVLNIQIADKGYWKSIELSSGVVIDVSQDGSIIGIEILQASKVFGRECKKVLEQTKIVA